MQSIAKSTEHFVEVYGMNSKAMIHIHGIPVYRIWNKDGIIALRSELLVGRALELMTTLAASLELLSLLSLLSLLLVLMVRLVEVFLRSLLPLLMTASALVVQAMSGMLLLLQLSSLSLSALMVSVFAKAAMTKVMSGGDRVRVAVTVEVAVRVRVRLEMRVLRGASHP